MRFNIAHMEEELMLLLVKIMLLLVKIMGHVILDQSFFCFYLNNLYLILNILERSELLQR